MQEIAQHHFTDLNKLTIPIHIGSFTGEFLYWGYFPAEYWRNYLHVHSFYEICYVFEGRGIFRICDHISTVEAGELFVAKPGEPHEIISDNDEPLGIYFWAFTLLPNGTISSSSGLRTKSSSDIATQTISLTAASIDRLLYAFGDSTCWISKKTGAITSILQFLTAEIHLLQPGYLHSIKNATENLLIASARAVTSSSLSSIPLPETNDAMVAKIVRYLKDNYARMIQVRDVAAQLHLSERHTSRIFRNVMGTSIQEYLTKLRISIAKQHLITSTMPISEIADAVGYNDARHFSTVFRLQTGQTPTTFRDNNGTQFMNQYNS